MYISAYMLCQFMEIDTHTLKRSIVRRSSVILAVCCAMTLLFAIFILACRLTNIIDGKGIDIMIITISVFLIGIIAGIFGTVFVAMRCIEDEEELREISEHIYEED